jgi:EAL domain-containing protein (putative c-di-GMP-specific phosphodiesterase class I)
VAALEGALAADMGSSLTLFINVAADCDDPVEVVPRVHEAVVERADRELRVVLEVTEEAIVARPAALLRLVDWARSRSWGIALDDVGADPDSLAIMPFLEPDVVKLDLRLVHEQASPDVGNLVSAVLAQAERTGAQIVAEGIETEGHKSTALALGATLGQGWLFGRPSELPSPMPTPPRAIELQRLPPAGSEVTPFSIVRAARPLRRGPKRLLVDLSSHLEEQAVSWHDNPVIISTFEPDEPLVDDFLERYAELARQGSFVAVIGADLPSHLREPDGRHLTGGIRVVSLEDGHRLGEEWSVIVVGPHYAGALVARRVGDDAYDFAVTHDRRLAVEAGRSLLRRLEPR